MRNKFKNHSPKVLQFEIEKINKLKNKNFRIEQYIQLSKKNSNVTVIEDLTENPDTNLFSRLLMESSNSDRNPIKQEDNSYSSSFQTPIIKKETEIKIEFKDENSGLFNLSDCENDIDIFKQTSSPLFEANLSDNYSHRSFLD